MAEASSSDIDELTDAPEQRLVLWQRAHTTDDEHVLDAWVRGVATRLSVAGGELILSIGGSVVALFDAVELDDTIELAVDLLAEAATRDGLEVAVSLTSGPVSSVDPAPAPGPALVGAPLDRAQVLVAWARPGELVVDEATHGHAADRFLFGRAVRAPGARGHVLDSQYPRRRDCRAALPFVGEPPLLGSAGEAVDQLVELTSTPARARLALRTGAPHTALAIINRAIELQTPECVLKLEPRANGMQPLGALAAALAGLPDDYLDGDARAPLRAIRDGQAVERIRAAAALAGLLRASADAGEAAWLILHRATELDRASLRVVLEAVAADGIDYLMCLTLPRRARVPVAFSRDSSLTEIDVSVLALADRNATAAAVLRVPPDSALARRVAVLGGSSAISIQEAARTLVGSGDLVRRDEVFVWRNLPRSGSRALPVSALLTERIAGLAGLPHRVLEALVVAPPGASEALVDAILALDGLDQADIDSGIDALEIEGWVVDGSLGVAEAEIRSALLDQMPPARTAELHRFVAEAIRSTSFSGGFDRGLLAYHLACGGLETQAGRELLPTAEAAAAHGFERTALQLAVLAQQWDDSENARATARALATSSDTHDQRMDSLAPGPPEPDDDVEDDAGAVATGAIGSAMRAIARGDADTAESHLDTAMAAGWTRAGAQRLLSVAQLSRGDVHEALRTLRRAHVAEATDSVRAREAVTGALICLRSGDAIGAIRAGLTALALSRELGEQRGVAAALAVLSSSYEALGRRQDADQLKGAAASAAS